MTTTGTHHVSRAVPWKRAVDEFKFRNEFLDQSQDLGEDHMLMIMVHNLQWKPCTPRSRAMHSCSLCGTAPFPHVGRVTTAYYVRSAIYKH
jgi:hypothetical protein